MRITVGSLSQYSWTRMKGVWVSQYLGEVLTDLEMIELLADYQKDDIHWELHA